MNDKRWHLQYEKLVEFKRQHGHCLVPKRYIEDASLGNWVGTQRTDNTNKDILQDRKEVLDELLRL
jgi:hypothetical protein